MGATFNTNNTNYHYDSCFLKHGSQQLTPSRARGAVISIHRAAEKEGILGNQASGIRGSRKLGFRYQVFSETRPYGACSLRLFRSSSDSKNIVQCHFAARASQR
jgi:hypothetical protein